MHLDRLISVLESIATAGRPLSASELHQITGLPRATCYRLLQTLTEHRLLETNQETNRYQIGERLIRIGLLGQSDTDLCAAATPVLKDAATNLGDAVFLSRFRDEGVEIIHVETPANPDCSYIHPGLGFRPMHACSCSKVIAAFADEEFQQYIANKPLKAYTAYTKKDAQSLLTEFATIRQQGYAECVEEIEIGIASVAAPIRGRNLGTTFSVGAIGSIRNFTKKRRATVGTELTHLAERVGNTMRFAM